MVQQFTPLFRLNVFCQKNYCPGSIGFTTTIVLWLTGLFAAPPLSASPKNASLPGDSLITATICANETYFFNGESLNTPGEYLATFTASDGTDSVVTLQLSVLPIATGNVAADICQGETYNFNGELLSQSGIYVDTLSAENGCDSLVTLILTVLPNPLTNLSAAICAGSFYIFQGDTLTESGNYSIGFPAFNGCDSLVRLKLDVVAYFDISIAASICHGDFYIFAGDTLDTEGVYTDSLTAAGGCDSIVTLKLKVLPVSSTQLTAAICEGSEYVFQGDTLTVSGSYADTLQAANGCDSLVTLTLEVVPFFEINLVASVCEGEIYIFGNDTLDVTGVYVDSLTAAGGCDSIVTLTLTVLPVQHSALEATICQGDTIEYNGESLSEAGVYEFVLTGENGCDSTVTLTLNVLPLANTALEATICQGEAYDFNGEILTEAGVYDAVFDAENGCDSTVTLTLTVLPTQQTAIEASVCEGNSYEYNGEILTESGSYEFVFDGSNGCDSIVTLTLNVLPLSSSMLSVVLCESASYEFNGTTLTESGTYITSYPSVNGCDSTVTLQLAFVQFFETNLQASICSGEFYEFGSDTLTESGEYSMTLTAAGSCDSIVNLTLTVLPLGESITDASICAGEFYEFNGDTITASGAYTTVLPGSNGCDSIAVLNLTVLPAQNISLAATICADETYNFNGETLTEPGTYTAELIGENGCDSTVVLNLTIVPLQSSSFDAVICQGESYIFNGQILTDAGAYEYNFDGSNGCDSIVTLNLSVLPLAEGAFAAINCNGDSYEYNGTTLTESGVYEFTFAGEAANGCDSVVTLYLTIFPLIPPTETFATICAGETYDFYGSLLTVSGTYSIDLASTNGCDSTVVLELTVLPNATSSVNASVCKGEGYEFNGETIFASGTYTATLQAANGCDSVAVLNLTVIVVNDAIGLQNGTLTAQANNATFQWLNCDVNQPIPGATSNTYTPGLTGNYAAIVTQNGCTDTSACLLVQVVSVIEILPGSAWTIQPNPARSATTLMFKDALQEELRLEIYDAAGRLLYSQNIISGSIRTELDLAGFPDGLLLTRLVNKHGASTKRFVKADN